SSGRMPIKPPAGGRFLGDVLSFGWALPASIAAGAGLGWLGDRLFHTFPVLTIVMGLLGMVGGMRQLLRESDRLSRDVSGDSDKPDPDSGGPPRP
ncbi:MAG: AtpZ/AtpI family protein, partial [Thermoanaerobaculia bacterium]